VNCPHGPALSSLSDSGALSSRAAAKAAASIASEHPWPGAPLVAGAAFEVVDVLAAASASARCCRLARRPPFRRFGGCRTAPECVVVADVELVTDWGGSGDGRVAGISASTVFGGGLLYRPNSATVHPQNKRPASAESAPLSESLPATLLPADTTRRRRRAQHPSHRRRAPHRCQPH
jgi:hypothetical protein